MSPRESVLDTFVVMVRGPSRPPCRRTSRRCTTRARGSSPTGVADGPCPDPTRTCIAVGMARGSAGLADASAGSCTATPAVAVWTRSGRCWCCPAGRRSRAYVFLVLRSCCNSTLEPFSVLDHANLDESKPGICPIFPYLESIGAGHVVPKRDRALPIWRNVAQIGNAGFLLVLLNVGERGVRRNHRVDEGTVLGRVVVRHGLHGSGGLGLGGLGGVLLAVAGSTGPEPVASDRSSCRKRACRRGRRSRRPAGCLWWGRDS